MNVHSVKARAAAASGSRRRGRPPVGDKRRQILDAALYAFAERGYHGVAVPDVAAAAKVSTGSVYVYFDSKETLVNEVFRDAKNRLRSALFAELAPPVSDHPEHARAWFDALWSRLGVFARKERQAFRFLEMQDHVPYLDAESKRVELAVLAPLLLVGTQLFKGGPPVEVAIALLWGAFVGLVKASRLGYFPLDNSRLAQAGDACWRMIAPPSTSASKPATHTKGT